MTVESSESGSRDTQPGLCSSGETQQSPPAQAATATPRAVPCSRCGDMVTEWVDPEWSGGRLCEKCEAAELGEDDQPKPGKVWQDSPIDPPAAATDLGWEEKVRASIRQSVRTCQPYTEDDIVETAADAVLGLVADATDARRLLASDLAALADGSEVKTALAAAVKAKLADATARAERAVRELIEANAACGTIINSLSWTGDGYEWSPEDGDYRESVIDVVRRGARNYTDTVIDAFSERDALREKLAGAAKAVVEWQEKQGHDKCHYYPDLFNRLAAILDVPTEPSDLPPLEEFDQGCRRYQQELYGASAERDALREGERMREALEDVPQRHA